MLSDDAPLRTTSEVVPPSENEDAPATLASDDDGATTLATGTEGGPDGAETPTPARPPTPRTPFKVSTFIIVFLGFLGFWMLIETSFRNQLAGGLGVSAANPGPLYYLIGFSSQHLLATMAFAGALEMLITALAYNYTTDWTKAARVAKWN